MDRVQLANVRKLLLFRLNQTQPAPNPVPRVGRRRAPVLRVRALTTERFREIRVHATQTNTMTAATLFARVKRTHL